MNVAILDHGLWWFNEIPNPIPTFCVLFSSRLDSKVAVIKLPSANPGTYDTYVPTYYCSKYHTLKAGIFVFLCKKSILNSVSYSTRMKLTVGWSLPVHTDDNAPSQHMTIHPGNSTMHLKKMIQYETSWCHPINFNSDCSSLLKSSSWIYNLLVPHFTCAFL